MEHYFTHILGCYISPTFCHIFFSYSFKTIIHLKHLFCPYLLASKCCLLYFSFFINCLWFLKYFTGRPRLFNGRFHCDNIPHNWGQKLNRCLINGIHFWGNNWKYSIQIFQIYFFFGDKTLKIAKLIFYSLRNITFNSQKNKKVKIKENN